MLSVSLYRFLEVLVVLAGVPGTSPGKSVPDKEFVAQIVFIDLVGKTALTVGVRLGGDGRYLLTAVLSVGDVRIVKRVHINGKAVGMF